MALTPYLSSFGDYLAELIEERSKASTNDMKNAASLKEFRENEDFTDAVVIWFVINF